MKTKDYSPEIPTCLNILTSKSSREWELIRKAEGFYLESKVLKKNGFKNGFFTRHWKGQLPTELVKQLSKNASTHLLKQVHGKKIIKALNSCENNPQEADGLISNHSEQSLWVATADCVPVLIGDAQRGTAAACHIGWRGVALEAIKEMLKKLIHEGSNPENLIFTLGPSISGYKYEVEKEVALLIKGEKKLNNLPEERIFNGNKLSQSIFEINSEPNKFYADLRSEISNQLIKLGLNKGQIIICPVCTFSEPDYFYSRRRDKFKAVQWSGIVSKAKSVL